MVVFPPCKINLGLQILSKRADGYHDIETCFYPVPWTDILEAIPADEFKFTQTGLSIEGPADSNLCVRAYELLRKHHSIRPAHLHLHKLVPMGAGLGGGSADAAFALRLLNDVSKPGLPDHKLEEYASLLGSDCAFFIRSKPMIGTGRGEILSPAHVSLKGFHLIIVKPDVHVSTAEAYAVVTPKKEAHSVNEVLKLPLDQWKEQLVNHFESSVFARFPVIQSIKQKLYDNGALYASLSGSGAAVFGIFEKPIDLRNEFIHMTYWSGTLQD